MLRLFDANNVDITNQVARYGRPYCLGEPHCSAWGLCAAQEMAQELELNQAATMFANTEEEEEFDQLLLELSQELDKVS